MHLHSIEAVFQKDQTVHEKAKRIRKTIDINLYPFTIRI